MLALLLALMICFGSIDYIWAAPGHAILTYRKETERQLSWISERFAIKVGGSKPGTPHTKWMGYYDIKGPESIDELLRLKDWAADYNVVVEDALLHARVNYTYTAKRSGSVWSNMDKFDVFEGKNGILIQQSDGKYKDYTESAYKGVPPLLMISASYYIGYEEPFALIKFALQEAAKSLEGVWQFWNGDSWDTLHVNDGTNNMEYSGDVTFYPPATWEKTSINGSRKKYFIRYLFKSAGKYPVVKTIKGDDWLNETPYSGRGWDSASPTVINPGTPLVYNPSPPSNASAKFPYQARVSYWSANHFTANPANFQYINGVNERVWKEFLVFRINQLAELAGYSGIMCDDAVGGGNFDGLELINSDFPVTKSFFAEDSAKYSELATSLHYLHKNLIVGANSQSKKVLAGGDWGLAEYHTENWKTGSWRGITINDAFAGAACYDDYPALGANGNPVLGLLIYKDTADKMPNNGYPLDRANRQPIAALSKHLIAANDFTYFVYYTKGGYIYDEIDEVILNDNSVLHQSDADYKVPNLANVKRWATWFPAMGINFGAPDTKGHNNGLKDLKWKTPADINDLTPNAQPVWRRDYTNAIVLHRPGVYNNTYDQYATPSIQIQLGKIYYPLMADGNTSDGVRQIQLKHNEGAILMKFPVKSSK